MRLIALTKGYNSKISDQDYERVVAHKWHVSGGAYKYARTRHGSGYMNLANFVLQHKGIVDHINGDTLDNQRNNLRPATRAQNTANSTNSRNKSGYKGVSYYPRCTNKPWRACITVNGKGRTIGYYKTPQQASKAYCLEARRIWNDFARS